MNREYAPVHVMRKLGIFMLGMGKARMIRNLTGMATAISLAAMLDLQALEQPKPVVETPLRQAAAEDRFEIRNIEGWAIHMNRDVPRQHPEETARTLEHLRWELYQIKLAIPAAAVVHIQEHNAIWIEYDEKVALTYHPQREWLLERGYKLPQDPKAFMSLSVKTHIGDSYRHPFVVFHEFAHGYDFHFIGMGHDYGNAECQANYERMMKEGKYEKVKFYDGSAVSHYARTNRMEYWSESSESYFAVNDFYPFVRAEMREHDPQMVRLIERYWGVDPQRVAKLENQLVAYKQARQESAITAAGVLPKSTPTSGSEKRTIAGWTVYVGQSLADEPALAATMLTLLNYKLHMINHFISEQGRKQLHEVPIWLEAGEAGPYIRYCDSRERLKTEGANPEKFGAVEVRDPQRMMDWAMLEQSDVLHELALAYYDRYAVQNNSELGEKIQAAFAQAKQGGKYQSVLRFDGQRVAHPSLVNAKEYFAELMESYFLVNDHYPFIRCELSDQDPIGYALIAGLWEGNPRR